MDKNYSTRIWSRVFALLELLGTALSGFWMSFRSGRKWKSRNYFCAISARGSATEVGIAVPNPLRTEVGAVNFSISAGRETTSDCRVISGSGIRRNFDLPVIPFRGRVKYTDGGGELTTFDWNHRFSQKQYEIGPWLLWNVIGSHKWRVDIPMTFSDLWPWFQGHDINRHWISQKYNTRYSYPGTSIWQLCFSCCCGTCLERAFIIHYWLGYYIHLQASHWILET